MTDDYDLPERLWATVAGIQPQGRVHGIWDQDPSRSALFNWREYVRADTKSFYQEKDIDAMQARIAALEAERDRLRLALQWIDLNDATMLGRLTHRSAIDTVAKMNRIARAVLEGGGDG